MTRQRAAGAALFLISLALGSGRLANATKNFCGATWGAASSNCVDRQPCPMGTDEECTTGGPCWGDTTCDSALGHGILYDYENPVHSRFCGKAWDDANNNCSLKRHCPGGDSSECPGKEECYSFLSGCNYVDMIGGPTGGGASASASGGDAAPARLNSNDPSRNNFCGSDWNDALLSCSMEDHWCQSGADDDCPPGKLCFAGTECKYIADMTPTESPTDEPTYVPTPMPTEYDTIENTRFCAVGWEDAFTTCRIGTSCPGGSNSECPAGQVCFGWISGCNLIDFQSHLKETGQQIFGAEHWLLPPEMEAADEAASSSNNVPQPPPSEIYLPAPTGMANAEPQTPPAEIQIPTPPTATNPPTSKPITSPNIKSDPNAFDAENHIFCGLSWTDASDRCSPETFCSDGAAMHKCANSTDYCWVGVMACNAALWVPTANPSDRPTMTAPVTTAPSKEPTQLPTPSPTPLPTIEEVVSTPTTQSSSNSQTDASQQVEEESETTIIRQSYCATDYAELMSACATLSTCNRYKPCPDGYMCYSNVKCVVTVPKPAPDIPAVAAVPTTSPPTTYAPITNAPITNAPVIATSLIPPTYYPTYNPTSFRLSDEEVAKRLTNMNSYCATSLSEVMSSCSYSLHTCNAEDNAMCAAGTFCFENIVCPDSEVVTRAPVTAAPMTTMKPTAAPIITTKPTPVESANNNLGGGESNQSNAVGDVAQNYCAQSLDQLLLTCSTAPTCNDDDWPCPSGMFCFGNTICNDSSSLSGSLESSTSPTYRPTSKPTPPNNDGDTVIPQNYCSKSEDELQSTCSMSQTCNDGDGPCPSGSFCFGNYSCSSNQSSSSVATLKPTKKPTVSAISQSKPNVDAQNYCAQSAAQLETTCAWATTCNGGDGPCPSGTFCFPNIICEARQVDSEPWSPTLSPTSMPTLSGGHNSIDHDAAAATTTADPACDELCLQPIDLSDCNYLMSIESMDILPCTGFPSQVDIDDFCTGTGQCGTNLGLNNCPDDKDVYVRLDSSKCVEHGLVDGSGVVPPLRIEGDEDSPHIPGIGVEGNETAAREASTNSSLGNSPAYGRFNGNYTNSDDLTGWWLKENNSARSAGDGWIVQLLLIASALGLMISYSPLSW